MVAYPATLYRSRKPTSLMTSILMDCWHLPTGKSGRSTVAVGQPNRSLKRPCQRASRRLWSLGDELRILTSFPWKMIETIADSRSVHCPIHNSHFSSSWSVDASGVCASVFLLLATPSIVRELQLTITSGLSDVTTTLVLRYLRYLDPNIYSTSCI